MFRFFPRPALAIVGTNFWGGSSLAEGFPVELRIITTWLLFLLFIKALLPFRHMLPPSAWILSMVEWMEIEVAGLGWSGRGFLLFISLKTTLCDAFYYLLVLSPFYGCLVFYCNIYDMC